MEKCTTHFFISLITYRMDYLKERKFRRIILDIFHYTIGSRVAPPFCKRYAI